MNYTVMQGDTLFGICRRFRVGMQDVLRLNPQIRNPNVLRISQVIVLPDSVQVIEDCPVPEPVIVRFIPVGAQVVQVRLVRILRIRVPLRVIIFRIGNLFGFVIIRFTCALGFQVVFRRLNIRVRVRVLRVVRLFGDDREQVVIGTTGGDPLSFTLIGAVDDRVEEMIDRLDARIERGRIQVRDRDLVVASPTGGMRFTFNGTRFVERAL